ncbi:PEP/pyruvate-binding domain-containing protein [Actinokineospora sp. 24-640]
MLVARGDRLLDPVAVGHKFARLESMRRAGLPVPPLFCLTADAFDAAKAPGGLPAPSADIRAWSERAAASVGAVGGPLAREVLAAFDDLVGPDGLVAVRACVVPAPGQPGEDDAGDPFAGMSESFLYVPREDVVERVRQCWASAYKAEAVLYRLRRGGDPAAARVAVGVQRMVLGVRSFVAFTRDPRDGVARHVIAAAYGIGEGVVQEKADVDHFFVEDGAVRAELVTKRRMVGPPAGGSPAVPGELADVPVLDDALIARVVAIAERIEEYFGGPQDIEGTVTEDGAVHIVQARPMVAAAAEKATVPWSNHNVTESYPGVSSALTYTVARDFYRLIFTDLYRRVGVPEHRLRANAHHLGRMIGLIDGRVYYRLDAWLALHSQMRAFEFIRGWWELGMGLAETPAGPPSRPGRRLRALRAAPRLVAGFLAHPGQVRDFLRWWDRTAAAARVDERGPDELVRFYRELWGQVGTRWGITLTNSIHTILVTRALDALLRRWAGQEDHALMLGLLSGGPENRSLASLRSAIALAELVGRDRGLRERVLSADADLLWTEVVEGRHGPRVAAAAAEHLRRFGDRAAGDLKLEQPTPRQRPGLVVDMIRPFVRQGQTVRASRAGERRARRETEAALRAACPGRTKRAVLGGLAAVLRLLVKAREDTRFCRTELYGLSRRVFLRLGAHLTDAGHLDRPEDVVDLTVEEVLGAFEGTLPGSDLRGLVAIRRADRDRYTTLPEPPAQQVTTVDTPLAEPRPLAVAAGPDEDVLRGLASCAGVVRARAKVVLHPSVPPEECRDRVLIARETDPGWLFLMTVAKGLVVERGTLLSHTAITGRLLGVPTVVAVREATTRIPDGAWVELDGAAGTVRLIEVEVERREAA